MAIFSETLPASYAGISFLMDRSRVEGGRKDVLKEFPNSNLQTVEDLGLRPRTFTVEAIINQDRNGENYIQRRDNFLRALEKGGSDVLIHPLYGRIENIVVRTFTLNEDFTSLGEAKFSITFALSDSTGTPIVSGDTLSVVDNSVVSATNQVNNNVIENFSISNAFPENFTNAINKVNDIVNAFERNTTFLQVTAEGIDNFSEQLVELRNNITSLINIPRNLVNSIQQLFDTVDGLYSDNNSTFEVIERFFNFGDEDIQTPIEQNTVGRIERARNQNLLNNLIKAEALLLNYRNASQINFTTIAQVNSFADILENQYQSVITNANFDNVTLDAITQTRIEVQQFFDEQQLSASQIVDTKTVVLPARVIAYQYYGSANLGFNVAALNNDLNVSFIQGDIQVFTE